MTLAVLTAEDVAKVAKGEGFNASQCAVLITNVAPVVDAVNAALCGPLGINREIVKAERTIVITRVREGARSILLPHYPIDLGETFEVREAWYDHDFSDDSTITDATYYEVDPESGTLYRTATGGRRWCGGFRGIQVQYTAGLVDDADDARATYPQLVRAAALWAWDNMQRGKMPSAVSTGKAAGSMTWDGVLAGPPKAAVALMAEFRRVTRDG